MCKIVLLFFLCWVGLGAVAQQPATAAAPTNPSVVIDKDLHENVVQLIELMGVHQRLESNLDQITQQGKERILHDFPSYDPAFSDEWAKRMRAQTKVDDYVDVFVRVYEAHFDNNEIVELIQAQRDFKDQKATNFSPHLKDKLAAIGITLQSEILGGCTQVGAKLGGEIGLQIYKEHPEWVRGPKSQDAPVTKE